MAILIAIGLLLAQALPAKIGDAEFWQLITDMSEPNGFFRFENFLSNERAYQEVIPALQAKAGTGGSYIGVGPEQNFTYIAALRPKIAFVLDIRRQNTIEHLMYKALFELSDDRADFLSRLFSRSRPSGLTVRSTAEELFRSFEASAGDSALFERNRRAIIENLTVRHGFLLSEDDQRSITYIFRAFLTAGPKLNYDIAGGPIGSMPTYSDLMTEADLNGVNHAYLATEENFRIVKDLEAANLVIPITGDFAGPKALREIGRYLAAHRAPVTAFYLSNVERYLFEELRSWRRFYVNVAILPYDSRSQFVRSVLNGGYRSKSVISSMDASMKAFSEGKIETYEDVLALSN